MATGNSAKEDDEEEDQEPQVHGNFQQDEAESQPGGKQGGYPTLKEEGPFRVFGQEAIPGIDSLTA